MKIKEGFELREMCGENIIVAKGVQNIDFNKIPVVYYRNRAALSRFGRYMSDKAAVIGSGETSVRDQGSSF